MPLEQVIQLGRTTLQYAILAALPLLGHGHHRLRAH